MVKPDWEPTRRQLIETYRTLNHRVRSRGEQELSAAHNGDSIRAEVDAMRINELQFAKALSAALLGDAVAPRSDDEVGTVTGSEGTDDPTIELISQFGSARATTLNTMSGVADEVWDRPLIENRRLLDLANELVESDRMHMDRITRMIGA
jgi:hypothetical protein